MVRRLARSTFKKNATRSCGLTARQLKIEGWKNYSWSGRSESNPRMQLRKLALSEQAQDFGCKTDDIGLLSIKRLYRKTKTGKFSRYQKYLRSAKRLMSTRIRIILRRRLAPVGFLDIQSGPTRDWHHSARPASRRCSTFLFLIRPASAR